MAELSTLARPYARAAFEFARDKQQLPDWSAQLGLAATVAGTGAVARIMSSPELTSEQQANTLLEVCGDSLTAPVQNFIKVLAENKRLPLLAEIFAIFAQFKANQERSVDVEVQTAFDLDSATSDKLVSALKAKLERDVKVNTVVDKSLLGGVLVRAGDIVIDGSVRGRLAKLAEAMNS